MNLEDIYQSRLAILGFGVEGQALARFFISKGVSSFTVFDEKEPSSEAAKAIGAATVELKIGPFEQQDLSAFDYVFRSPGINLRRIKTLVDEEKITSATDLFLSSCQARTIGITGTKGKTTTAKMIEKILILNDKKVFVGGNIGVVPLDYLDEITSNDYVVLELSSFQLEDISVSPSMAVILPISSDHLDYHRDVEEYALAKSNICKYQEASDRVIFYDEGKSAQIALQSQAQKTSFSDQHNTSDCFIRGESIVCTRSTAEEIFDEAIHYSNQCKIPIVNILAAVSFAWSLNLKLSLADLFEGFKKMPYRIELVGEFDGVRFYNDSASTNPVSAIAAVQTFAEPYFLIAGGSSKGLNYDGLAQILSRDESLTGVYLSGQTANEIARSLKSAGYSGDLIISDSLANSLRALWPKKNKVKAVLFSPASASFDQFKNYKDRGEAFNQLIKSL